jgi:hypothetical protein
VLFGTSFQYESGKRGKLVVDSCNKEPRQLNKLSPPNYSFFSMISNAFDFPLLLVPLNRIRSPYNFLKNYRILGAYSFAVLETCFFFFFFPKQQNLFQPCNHALGNQLKKQRLKKTKKLKATIWKQLKVVFENKFVCSGK